MPENGTLTPPAKTKESSKTTFFSTNIIIFFILLAGAFFAYRAYQKSQPDYSIFEINLAVNNPKIPALEELLEMDFQQLKILYEAAMQKRNFGTANAILRAMMMKARILKEEPCETLRGVEFDVVVFYQKDISIWGSLFDNGTLIFSIVPKDMALPLDELPGYKLPNNAEYVGRFSFVMRDCNLTASFELIEGVKSMKEKILINIRAFLRQLGYKNVRSDPSGTTKWISPTPVGRVKIDQLPKNSDN